jgi:two-component system NtrC family sensor kinase
MIAVSLTAAATRLLNEQGVNVQALDWHVSDKPDAFAICATHELTQTLASNPPGVLIVARREDVPPLLFQQISVPFEVALLPVSHADELNLRSYYLAQRAAHKSVRARTNGLNDEEIGMHRLALAGRVSAGVAHEMRNALSYARANTTYLKETIESGRFSDPELKSVAEEALEGITRALEASQMVLSLARGVKTERKPIDLNKTVKKAAKLVRLELHHDVKLELDLTEVPDVMGDFSALIQVFTNLMLNAVDAVGPGGRVLVHTEKVEDKVAVSVADDGPGIPEEIASKLFQPFTSGKPGRGTGLGLAISRSIIQSLGGTIQYETGSLGGAQFRVSLQSA